MTIARGVTDGQLAYAGKRGDEYQPFVFRRSTTAADIEIGDDVVVLRKEDAERIQAAIEAGKPAKPSSIPPPVSAQPDASEARASSPPPLASVRSVAGFRWEGELPWQKWSQFYSKVFSRFSQKGLRLRVVVEVAPPAGVNEQDLQETRTALKELGLADELKVK